ncbi:MAG: 3-hydroxybutyryl-CoA dehydrogenase [Maricaulaceae bacterium]
MERLSTIGVIGAGQMGSGIALACARAGLEVILHDIAPDRLIEARHVIDATLARSVARGRLDQSEADTALAHILFSDQLDAIEPSDIAVEAVDEDEAVKRALYDSLRAVLRPNAILATNTSSLSITRLASATDRPSQFIGFHFMNPAPRMRLVELIRGIQTDQRTFDLAQTLARRLDKVPANAEDFPAFIVNRILVPMINEAVYVLYEGVGTVQAIDDAMKLGANHPMGPLELADFIGLDTCLSIMRVLHEEFADTKYRPCPLLVKYVEAGWLGRKTERGFYDYRCDPPEPTR